MNTSTCKHKDSICNASYIVLNKVMKGRDCQHTIKSLFKEQKKMTNHKRDNAKFLIYKTKMLNQKMLIFTFNFQIGLNFLCDLNEILVMKTKSTVSKLFEIRDLFGKVFIFLEKDDGYILYSNYFHVICKHKQIYSFMNDMIFINGKLSPPILSVFNGENCIICESTFISKNFPPIYDHVYPGTYFNAESIVLYCKYTLNSNDYSKPDDINYLIIMKYLKEKIGFLHAIEIGFQPKYFILKFKNWKSCFCWLFKFQKHLEYYGAPDLGYKISISKGQCFLIRKWVYPLEFAGPVINKVARMVNIESESMVTVDSFVYKDMKKNNNYFYKAIKDEYDIKGIHHFKLKGIHKPVFIYGLYKKNNK